MRKQNSPRAPQRNRQNAQKQIVYLLFWVLLAANLGSSTVLGQQITARAVKKEDSVTVRQVATGHLLVLHSSSGIGSAVVVTGRGYRGVLSVRLNTLALEMLTITNTRARVTASLRSATGSYPTPHELINLKTGKVTPHKKSSRYYIHINKAEQYCSFTIPLVLLPTHGDTLTIHWVDYYR